MIIVSDYSTETGLRVRVSCDTTDTTIQIPADEWQGFLELAKAGVYDDLAQAPRVPFIHWPGRQGEVTSPWEKAGSSGSEASPGA